MVRLTSPTCLSRKEGIGGSTTKSDFREQSRNDVLSPKTEETQLAATSSKSNYLLSFSCDCASRDFVLLSFWQVFDELYPTQIVIKSLVTLTVDVKIYKLDVCKFIEPESVSL